MSPTSGIKEIAITALIFAACVAAAAQQHPGANFDEAKVPHYKLPDPLVTASVERVRYAKAWTAKRRPEILEMYGSEMLGHSPAKPAKLDYEVVSIDKLALGGTAVRNGLPSWQSATSISPA
jgi:hypothetical protein